MKAAKAQAVEQATPAASEFVHDVKRSETEVIRVSTREYKGVQYVDMRIFFKDKAGVFRPTKKGITVRREQVHELAKAVCLVEEAIAA